MLARTEGSTAVARGLARHQQRALLRTCGGTGAFLLALAAAAAHFGEFGARTLALALESAALLGLAVWMQRHMRRGGWPVVVPQAWTWLACGTCVVSLVATALIFPMGPASASAAVLFGLSLFVLAPRMRDAVLLTVVGAAAWRAAYEVAGGALAPESHTGLSDYAIVIATTMWLTVTTAVMASVASRESVASRAQLAQRERSLRAERRRYEEHRRQIERTNVRLAEEREALLARASADATLADELARQLAHDEAMAAGMHQYLSEPLRNVVSFTQLIKRRLERDAAAAAGVTEYFGYVEDGARRMSRMLTDLQAYAQPDRYREPEMVDLSELLAELRLDLEAALVQTGGTLEVGTLPEVMGHRTQLVQLFQNLISNALKFGRDGVPVRVRVVGSVGPAGEPVVEVLDNGLGIPANQLDKVFGLFNRAHAHMSREGSGVGLALCQRIAVAHAAELTVTSVEGEGSRFRIVFQALVLAGHARRATSQAQALPV